MQKSTKKAFTLVELLIVIAVIGILFVVLISKVDFATDKSKATGVQTDFRSFQLAFETVARENSGFNTLGWDEGDTNGDRIRNAYDEGDNGAGDDTKKNNGIKDPGEVWTGRKVYAETWTGIFTLVNPADEAAGTVDDSAIGLLEDAINKNLDPKLHITIANKANGYAITMKNQARDPWKTEYVGKYLTNASAESTTNTVDANKAVTAPVLGETSLDRGAIIIYSLGANATLGSVEEIEKGVVVVTDQAADEVAGTANKSDRNVAGSDDFSLSTIYTYKNGYGEVISATTGFTNNQ